MSLSFCSYLLHCCLNLIGKFRLVIEDGSISSSNLTKLHASAAQVFKLTANDLFNQDDLLQDTRGDAFNYRTYHACGRRSFGRRACGRQGSPWQSSYSRFDSPRSQIAHMGHDQRPRHHLHPTSRHCSTPCRLTQGSESLDPAEPLSGYRSIQQPG